MCRHVLFGVLLLASILNHSRQLRADDTDYSEDRDTIKELQDEDAPRKPKTPEPKQEAATEKEPDSAPATKAEVSQEKSSPKVDATPEASLESAASTTETTATATPESTTTATEATTATHVPSEVPSQEMDHFRQETTPTNANIHVSDGQSSVELKGKGLSLTPPKGWEVSDNAGGLMFQTPAKAGLRYRATIQVNAYDGAKFIDAITVSQFKEELEKKYSNLRGVRQFQVSTSSDIQLDDGTKAILYYTDFMLGETQMMQMHVLLSSQTFHYLVTYTDLAEEFTKQDETSNLRLAYTTVTTAKPETRVQSRLNTFSWIAITLGLIIVGGFVYRITSMKRLRRIAEEADRETIASESDAINDNNKGPLSGNEGLEFSQTKPISAKSLHLEQEEKWALDEDKSDIKTLEEDEVRWKNLEKKADISSETEEKEKWTNLSQKPRRLNKDEDDGEPVDEDQDKAV